MSSIPMRGKGPKLVNKSVMVEGPVYEELVARGVNVSELCRQAMGEALRQLQHAETASTSTKSQDRQSTKRR